VQDNSGKGNRKPDFVIGTNSLFYSSFFFWTGGNSTWALTQDFMLARQTLLPLEPLYHPFFVLGNFEIFFFFGPGRP
jgi:hypothetical protein